MLRPDKPSHFANLLVFRYWAVNDCSPECLPQTLLLHLCVDRGCFYDDLLGVRYDIILFLHWTWDHLLDWRT